VFNPQSVPAFNTVVAEVSHPMPCQAAVNSTVQTANALGLATPPERKMLSIDKPIKEEVCQ
jgi:hypothetical protein